ncbi:NepR family anti-sigma factor [Microvirga massiliensis]|uniref:NepR family anti-sigma factor n=1 Tax=Microvirga massiliensis TaxID=1033741 RepID=UPI0012B69376|nr:hypothetical protein [Microvirga massiliensis]
MMSSYGQRSGLSLESFCQRVQPAMIADRLKQSLQDTVEAPLPENLIALLRRLEESRS